MICAVKFWIYIYDNSGAPHMALALLNIRNSNKYIEQKGFYIFFKLYDISCICTRNFRNVDY